MNDFAPPIKKLGESGRGVAAAPTGGMGLSLDENGKLPAGVLFLDTTARRIAFGVVVVTFAGVAVAATGSVSHGLGVTPQVILMTPQTQSGLNSIPATEASAYTATTFTAQAWTIDAQVPVNGSTATIAWLAIG